MTPTLGFAGAAALGIGMLVGLERERHKGQGRYRAFAGFRTYTITAFAWWPGSAVVVDLQRM